MAQHNGTIHAIKAALRSGDMTADQISRVTSIKVRQVTNAIQDSRKSSDPVHTVGKVKVGKGMVAIYSMTSPVKVVHERLDKPRRYVPEFKAMEPSHYDLWAHRSLALLGR